MGNFFSEISGKKTIKDIKYSEIDTISNLESSYMQNIRLSLYFLTIGLAILKISKNTPSIILAILFIIVGIIIGIISTREYYKRIDKILNYLDEENKNNENVKNYKLINKSTYILMIGLLLLVIYGIIYSIYFILNKKMNSGNNFNKKNEKNNINKIFF